VHLFGAAQARREKIETQRWANQEIEYQASLDTTKNLLPEYEWQDAWNTGYLISPDQFLEFLNKDHCIL